MDASLQSLENLLKLNYEALGFEMREFKVHQDFAYGGLLRILLRCPCGGYEYLNCVLDPDDLKPEYRLHQFAIDTLHNTANYHHLKNDVDAGTLPPFDIEKHVFKTLKLVA